MKNDKSLVVAKPQIEQTPMTLMAQAIQKNIPVETMEKLMDLQERWDKKNAQKEFNQAMADFQAKCPVIKKNKEVMEKDGKKARYSFASLDGMFF